MDQEIVYAPLSDDEAIALHMGSKLYYKLNETGQLIYTSLRDGKDEESIAKTLSENFDVSFENAKNDVAFYANALRNERLLPA